MDFDKISSYLSKLNFYADIRIISSVNSSFSLEDEKIMCASGETDGIGVRTLINGSFGYAWSTNINDFPKLIKKAEKLARINKGIFSLSHEKSENAEIGKNFEFPDFNEKIVMMKEAKKYALSAKTKNTSLFLCDSNVKKIFMNNNGSCIVQKESYVYFSAVCVAKEGIELQKGHERLASRNGYGNFDIAKTAQNAKERAERLLNSHSPPKGRFLVIMDPEMSGIFTHEALGHASEGDSVAEQESMLAGKLGKKIASEKVSIIDDPTFDGFGRYFYDDEGVRARPVLIVENGVLKNYLHSRQSATAVRNFASRNFKTKKPKPKTQNSELETISNGHARAEDYEFAPIVRMSNTFFLKGNERKSDVFDVKEGIYVIGMKGGSVDIFNGDFMFAAKEGWLIKNGSKEKLLRDVTISGNIFESLARVESVGNNFMTSPGFCGKMGQSVPVSDGGPYVRVSEMKIG
ncbi:MAG: TldD/PmbA family protein [Candidatus Micrarchaeota archaeon]